MLLGILALAITGIVLISGCIDSEGKNKFDNKSTSDNLTTGNSNTTLNTSNTSLNATKQISNTNNSTDKTNNTTINTTNTTTNATTAINDTTNNAGNNTNNKTNGETTDTSSNKNITNTTTAKTATNTTETPVQTTMKTTIKNVNAKEAHKLIDENSDNENFVIIDIRTSSEFNSGHIKDAINIDYYANDFVEQLNDLDKSKTYLVYCRSGHRSGNAMQNFQQLKFGLVYDMLGGINSWKSAGFPVQ